MNNEFKKITKDDTTRYVLESATGGGTSSGSVATVSKALGGVQRRDNLLVQDTSQKLTPRSPVAHAAQKVAKGSGRHTDRKQQSKQVRGEKHKTKDFSENQDHEISMAGSELHSIFQNAKQLHSMIKTKSEEEGLDAWQQSKITKAADYLNSVLQSLQHEMMGEAHSPAQQAAIAIAKKKEAGVAEARVDQLPTKGADYSKYDTDHLKMMLRPGILHRNEAGFKALIRKELKKREQQSQQGVAEGSDYTPPKLGTVKANLMHTQEPTVQVQVFKHNTLRGDSYWVTKEVRKFKTMDQAQAYVDRINKQGVAEGSLNEGQYEMMMRNGQVKKFIAKDDADAKRIAAGHGAKSVIKLKGGVPAGKVSEQGVAEGGPFSYGKPPRKGSVAANAAQKRKEQDKKTPAIEPKDQRVGVAKVTKDVKESAGKICPQCGMKNCSCPPGKCKCKPLPGFPKKSSMKENQINELDRPSGKLFIIVKADNAGATHVFGDFGSTPQDVMHKVSKRGTRDKAGVKTKLKIDFLFDSFRSTIQQLRTIFRDVDFVGAEAAEFIIHSSALRSDQGEDVKHLRDYIEGGDDRRMTMYQSPEEDDGEEGEVTGGNILRIDPETGAARKVTGVKPQTQMGGKSQEQPGMTTYRFKDPRFAQQLRGMNLGFNIKGDSITVDQKQKQKLLGMLGNKFSDVFTDKERFKEQDASEAMLPKSSFAGSNKNKLGPAAHLKGSMRRPARQGDLVGGDAQESINLGEKAVSQQQQKFFGMVHAMQKGKKIPGASGELKKTAKNMSKSDAKDFAKTKHTGLPKKVKEGGMSLPPAGMNPEQARDFANAQMAGQQAINQHAAQQANTPPRGVNYSTDYLEKAADPNRFGRYMISVDDAKIALDWLEKNPNYRPPAAAQPSTPTTGSGYSREYLEKAADPNRFGRYMISVEKAQELLGQMKEDSYMESLSAALEQKLSVNDTPEVWRDDFEHADPVKYKQFRNKTVEKKHRMADVARYRQIQKK